MVSWFLKAMLQINFRMIFGNGPSKMAKGVLIPSLEITERVQKCWSYRPRGRQLYQVCSFHFSKTGIALYNVPKGAGPIWLDDLSCEADENSIFDCAHSGWGINNCDHSEDVGVSCFNVGKSCSSDS